MNKVFKALNDPTRREILKLLKEKDLSAGEVAEAFDISKPSISHHLDLLAQAELVSSEKKGQFIIYSLNTTVLDDIMQWIADLKATTHDQRKQAGTSDMGHYDPSFHLPGSSVEPAT